MEYARQAQKLIVIADSSRVTDLSELEIPFDPYQPEGFMLVESEPYTDIKEIQRHLKYPIMARMLGLQGTVNVCVLIGKSGVPLKAAVQSSDYKIFEKPALDAVMRLDWQPARLVNKQPIATKVSLPVTFRLR